MSGEGQRDGDRNRSIEGRRVRIFVTGSADGLGKATAKSLLAEGHEVVVHVRGEGRRTAVEDLVMAGATAVVGDLANLEQTRALADQVNALKPNNNNKQNTNNNTKPTKQPNNKKTPNELTAWI